MSSQPTKTDGQIAASTVNASGGQREPSARSWTEMCALPHIRFALKGWVVFADIPNDELRLASVRAG